MNKADSLAPPRDYLKTYSLTCEPFANTLDGRFFYAGPALMQRLDLLSHLTQFGDSVILVSGPQGSGKTTLLGRFAAQTGKQWRLCLINADEFVQFRQRLGDALGIGDSSSELQMLEQWASQHDASQLLVIVIDNTQQLQPDALQKLCDLLSQPQADRVRLIMFGTPDAQQALKQVLDRKELPCTAQLLEIPKLSEEETASYLMYRLAVAGYSGESPFTATEVRAICKAADGRPAAINELAHDALLEHQMRAHSKRLKPHRPTWLANRATWGLGTLLVVALAFYLGRERLQPEISPDEPQAQAENATPEIPLPLPEPAPVVGSAPAPSAEAPEPAVPVAGDVSVPEGEQSLPVQETASDERPTAVAVTAPDSARIPEPAATAAPGKPAPPTTSEQGRDTSEETPDTAVPPPEPKIAAVQAAAETTLQPPADATTAAETGETAAPESSEQPAPAATAKQSPTQPAAPEVPHREDWLLQQPPGRYSLQLLGSRQQASIQTYIKQNNLDPERCAYYRGKFQGGDWYVLMYGAYPDRESALAARAALPASVQKEKPWPRSLASVHSAIREAN